MIISDAVRTDHAVAAWLADLENRAAAEAVEVSLKGFDRERFALWRVRQGPDGAA